ncbi:hypothetical protein H6503_03555 [Candidatus Woesearchaeota archaeon]|nr:hypothetical protein [Candidatus Woesearchaeota archaeon]
MADETLSNKVDLNALVFGMFISIIVTFAIHLLILKPASNAWNIAGSVKYLLDILIFASLTAMWIYLSEKEKQKKESNMIKDDML